MSRNVTFAPGEYYHLYNRGTEKRDVYLDKADYTRFLILLYSCNSPEPVHLQLRGSTSNIFENLARDESFVDIGAYCLMPNHFHLLVKEKVDDGISSFMQKLGTAYTMYFNRRNERTGSLFQGRFKATYVNSDKYLKYLISYIHLNPIKLIDPKWKENGISDKVKAKKYLSEYKHSSYIDYLGEPRAETKILAVNEFPKYFKSMNTFKKEVDTWLAFSNTE